MRSIAVALAVLATASIGAPDSQRILSATFGDGNTVRFTTPSAAQCNAAIRNIIRDRGKDGLDIVAASCDRPDERRP